ASQHAFDVRPDGGHGFWTEHVDDGPADDVCDTVPEPICIGLADPEVPEVAAASAHRRRHRLDYRAELLLCLALRGQERRALGLDAPPLADVAGDLRGADDAP